MAANNILNYELAPSPATVFGCLLPAPWLGMVAGLLLVFVPLSTSLSGLPDRFSPLTLALTHVLVLGMLTPVMIGALFQLMPVVAGQTVRAARWIAPFVALGSALIASGLAIGFLKGQRLGFILAAVLAVMLYGAVILALATTAWRITVTDATTRTLRYIPIAFAAVIAFGVTLAGNLVGWWHIDLMSVLNLHVAWGLYGWIAALVAGVASTVVPMFWQTRRPDARWQRSLPAIFLFPLCFASLPSLWLAALSCACLLMWGFGLLALRALWRAKRRFDPAWIMWLVSTCSWLLAAAMTMLMSVTSAYFPTYLPQSLTACMPWWIGVLSLVGGAVLPVNAMLGKIIPFLVFLHLRRQIPSGRRVPTMQAVLPPQRLRWQAWLVLSALCLLLVLPVAPAMFAPIAGIVFAMSQAYMGSLLLLTLLRYRKELRSLFLTRTALDIPQTN
ncbi:hypothetical protein ACO0LB_01220 [Undibacterium sp. SXout7W]|uniref:hypothetical protein n=1 Tax=Undibacterium sp. SXout7W TaxID=3413049 RepID=UPI003BF08610